MRYTIRCLLFAAGIVTGAIPVLSETILSSDEMGNRALQFPDLATAETTGIVTEDNPGNRAVSPALWPFGKGDADVQSFKTKSTRKAFFLSLFMPGLGELYVGSKIRPAFFLSIEAFSWYTYFTNNSKGNDLTTQFEKFANDHWYYDTSSPSGYNYWNYLKVKFNLPADVQPTDYDRISKIIQGAGGGAHSLPSGKTQQYYEMIGKYDFFIYGWEDIVANNPSLVDSNGNPNQNYDIYTGDIKSPLRKRYEAMRGDANTKLKDAQTGVYIMMVNRVLSAIDAGRIAYKHNLNINSDLSMVRVRMAQKNILGNQVPMVMVYKQF